MPRSNKSINKSNNFIKVANRDVVARLEKMASIILYAMSAGHKPRALVNQLDSYFRFNFAEMNPLSKLDSYGVEQVLVRIARPDQLKRVKSYFKSAIDAWVRSKANPRKLHEAVVRSVYESTYLEETDYPEGFSVEEFKALPGIKQKLSYVNSKLEKLGTGSSRVVFRVNSGTVIKVAKNAKGIAQNDTEIDIGNGSSVTARVFDSDPEGGWLEMESAVKKNFATIFKAYTGYTFKDFGYALYYKAQEHKGRGMSETNKAYFQKVFESEFFNEVMDLVGNYDMPTGDLARPSSWGWVERDGQKLPVLIDFGLTQSVFDQYYGNKQRA